MTFKTFISAFALAGVVGTAYGDDSATTFYRLRLRSDGKGKSENAGKDFVVRGPLKVEIANSYPGVGQVPLSFAINADEPIELGKFHRISKSVLVFGQGWKLNQLGPAELVMLDGTISHTPPNKHPEFCGYLGHPYNHCEPGLLRFEEGIIPVGTDIQDIMSLRLSTRQRAM